MSPREIVSACDSTDRRFVGSRCIDLSRPDKSPSTSALGDSVVVVVRISRRYAECRFGSHPGEFFREHLRRFVRAVAACRQPALLHHAIVGCRWPDLQHQVPHRLDDVSGQGIPRSPQSLPHANRLPEPQVRRTPGHELLGRYQPAAGRRTVRTDLFGPPGSQDRQARPASRHQRGPGPQQAEDALGLRHRPAPEVPQGPLRLRDDRHNQHRGNPQGESRVTVPRAAG